MKTPFRAAGALMLGLSLCGGLLTTVQAAPAKGAKAGKAAKTAGTAAKGDRAGRGEGRRGDGAMRMMQELNLTDAQKAQLKPIMEAQRTAMMALRDDTTLTPEAKRAKLKQMRDDNETKINAILTADQKTKLAALKEKMKAERGAAGAGGKRGAGQRGQGRGPQAPVPAT